MPADSLTVLTWNLFSPKTTGVATKENPHYNHLSDEERYWEHRWPKIVEEITVADAAIVCCQEVEPDSFADIAARLSALGYDAFTHKKPQKRSALAIFFKRRLTKVWEKQVKVKGMEKTLACGLSDGGRVLAVVTCHLEGHPLKPLDRLAQLEKTLGEIKALPHDALVVAGDFNAPLSEEDGRDSAVSAYMASGAVPAGTTEWGHEVSVPDGSVKRHGYELVSAYVPGAVSIALYGEEPSLIDHIWYSGSLELTGVRDIFFDRRFRDEVFERGLPNMRNPSDHLPLCAAFSWK